MAVLHTWYEVQLQNGTLAKKSSFLILSHKLCLGVNSESVRHILPFKSQLKMVELVTHRAVKKLTTKCMLDKEEIHALIINY